MKQKLVDQDSLHKVDYGKVAMACELTEQALTTCLRLIMGQVESTLKKDLQVKLNLRIGFLKFKNGSVQFDNLATV